ncbi:MAG: putative pre-16S rRNA nuclease [Calditrichaeota bacterium]|nr:putative pre-16S rRNA nuclease [Calditrichota bacterium]
MPADPGRILAVDWGTVRIGIAVSDRGRTLASPLETLPAKPRARLLERLGAIVREQNVTQIIVGLPLNMDGSEGRSARRARRFAAELAAAAGVGVIGIDERLSSFEAERTLRAIGRQPSRDKGRVDRVAAALLLQEYLDRDSDPPA